MMEKPPHKLCRLLPCTLQTVLVVTIGAFDYNREITSFIDGSRSTMNINVGSSLSANNNSFKRV